MKCKAVQKRLPLYAGGDLSHRLARRIASHLQTCPVCRAEAQSFQRARLALVQAASPALQQDHQDYWARLKRRILQARWRKTSEDRLRERLLQPLLVGAAFALVLTVLLGLILGVKGLLPGQEGQHQQPAIPQNTALSPDSREPDSLAFEELPGPYQLELVTHLESEEPIDL